MSDKKRVQILENLIIDLTDGGLTRWDQIRSETGLSEERCKEMEKLINELFSKDLN